MEKAEEILRSLIKECKHEMEFCNSVEEFKVYTHFLNMYYVKLLELLTNQNK